MADRGSLEAWHTLVCPGIYADPSAVSRVPDRTVQHPKKVHDRGRAGGLLRNAHVGFAPGT